MPDKKLDHVSKGVPDPDQPLPRNKHTYVCDFNPHNDVCKAISQFTTRVIWVGYSNYLPSYQGLNVAQLRKTWEGITRANIHSLTHEICTGYCFDLFTSNGCNILLYRKVSNIRCTKCQNLHVSCLGLQLSLHNILKRSVKWRMKM